MNEELTIHRRRGPKEPGGPPPPWTPLGVPGLKLWLKPESIAALAEDDPVETWLDSSGQGNHAEAFAPTAPTASEAVTGGWAAVFDGVDDYMDIAGVGTAQAACIVCRYVDDATIGALLLGHYSLFDWHGGHTFTSDLSHVVNNTWASAAVTGGDAWVNGAATYPTEVIKPTAYQLLAFNCTGDTGVQTLANDRDYYWAPVAIAEVMLFSQPVSPADRAELEAYFNARYALW